MISGEGEPQIQGETRQSLSLFNSSPEVIRLVVMMYVGLPPMSCQYSCQL